MNSGLNRNIIANYIGRLWAFVSVYFFVPFYIKLIGIESYAVINFYTVILTLLLFADAGLSATLSREMARTMDKHYMGNLLFTIERLYIAICLFICISIFLLAPYIAGNWLNSNTLSLSELSDHIRLMGVCIAFQLFIILYSSGLMGLQKQVLANGLQVMFSVARSGLVLVPLYFKPDLYTYFIWQVIVNVSFFIITRQQLWKYIHSNTKSIFSKDILKTVGKFALGMMVMAIIASLNTQIDKLLISRLLTLKEFGFYSLGNLLAQSPVIIITPIAAAILPQMTRLNELAERIELTKLFHRFSFIITAFASAVAIVLFLYTKDFITIWTHDPAIAQNIDGVTKILLCGGLLLALQYMPYHLAIANGHTRTNLRWGMFTVVLFIPILWILISKLGVIGAAYPWFGLNLCAFLYLGYRLIRQFLRGEFKNWLVKDCLLPLIVSILVSVILYWPTRYLPGGYYVLGYGAVIGCAVLIANLFVHNYAYPESKIDLLQMIKNAKG